MWRQRDANRQLPAEFTTLCALDSREPAAAFVARLPRQLSQRRSWRRSYAMADSNLTPRPSPSSWKLKIRAKPVRNVAGSLPLIFMWAKLEQLPVAGLVKYSGNKRGYETGVFPPLTRNRNRNRLRFLTDRTNGGGLGGLPAPIGLCLIGQAVIVQLHRNAAKSSVSQGTSSGMYRVTPQPYLLSRN